MGWYIFAGILVLLWLIGMIAARIYIVFDGVLKLYIKVLGLIRIRILPSDKTLSEDETLSEKQREKYRRRIYKKALKKKANRAKKKAKEQKAKEKERRLALKNRGKRKPKPKEKPKTKEKRSIKHIIYLVKLALHATKAVIRKFGKYLYIKAVRINITVASDDAAKTAYMFGAASAALGDLMALLSTLTNFKAVENDDIGVYADFTSDTPSFDLKLVFRIRLWHVLAIALNALFALISYYIKHPEANGKKNKDDAKNSKTGKEEKNKTGKKNSIKENKHLMN